MKKIIYLFVIISLLFSSVAFAATPEIKGVSVGEKLLVFRYKSAGETFKVWVEPVIVVDENKILIPEKVFNKSAADNETLGTLVSIDISNLAPKTQFNVLVKDGSSTIKKLFNTPETTKPANTAKIKGNPVVKSKKMSFQIESSTKSVVWEVRVGSYIGTAKIGPKTETIPANQNYVDVKDVDLSVITGNIFWLVVKDAGTFAGIKNEDSRNLPIDDTLTEDKKEDVTPQKTPILENDYRLLAPIPGMSEVINKDNQIGDYINTMFNIFLGLCAALAVIMIIIKGIQWMGTDSVFGKTEAKSEIASAIGGLLLALGAWALLNTINPDLLGGKLDIKQVDIEIEGDVEAPTSVNKGDVTKIGIICNNSGGKNDIPSTAKSFSGKMTYSQELPKGKIVGNKVKLDCSGYVNYVLQCVGINTTSLGINSGTYKIFSNAEKVEKTKTTATSINGIDLKIGDLVGWKKGDNTDKYSKAGHVMIYIGGGMVADSHGGKDGGYGSFPLTKYKDQIKFVKRL